MARATGSPRLSRRGVLRLTSGLGAGLVLGPLPVLAQDEAGFDAFMRLSARLTGRDDLLPAQGQAAFAALTARFPGFADGLAGLEDFIDRQGGEPRELQGALDEAGAEFAWIPRQIVSAWYLGTVGAVEQPGDPVPGLTPPAAVEGTAAMRAIAWEQALMFTPLAGVIPIPTYAFRGDWMVPPEGSE